MLYPRPCTTLDRIVDRLASKPYPRGQGETGFESISGGLRV